MEIERPLINTIDKQWLMRLKCILEFQIPTLYNSVVIHP